MKPTPNATNTIGHAMFVETTTGSFRCLCGHTVTLTDERDCVDHAQGHAVAIHCPECGASGTIQRQDVEPSAL